MPRLRALLSFAAAATIGLTAVALGAASPAFAHDQLVGTDAVVSDAGALEAVTLSFNNSIIEVGTEIIVTDETDADVTDGDPEISGPDVTQPVVDGLEDGTYDVVWRVVSSDGHPIEGTFAVDLANGNAEIVDATLKDEHEHEESNAGQEHEHADEPATTTDEANGTPAWTVVAIVVAGAIIIAGALAVIGTRQRRRVRVTEERSGTDTGTSANPDERD